MSARALWEREVRAGMHGQDRQRPGTWTCDALWVAACWEAAAAEDRALEDAALRDGKTRLAVIYAETAHNKQARSDLALLRMLNDVEAAA